VVAVETAVQVAVNVTVPVACKLNQVDLTPLILVPVTEVAP
jgi:hypothetical protein